MDAMKLALLDPLELELEREELEQLELRRLCCVRARVRDAFLPVPLRVMMDEIKYT